MRHQSQSVFWGVPAINDIAWKLLERMHRGFVMSNRTTAIGIFLLALAAFASLAPQNPSNWQVVTRLGLTLSIVESGQLNIDRFADRTGDKAQFDGRYYTDKVPGLSFLAIPVVAAHVLIIHMTGRGVEPADFSRFAKTASIFVNRGEMGVCLGSTRVS
jgi:hypothetical protein